MSANARLARGRVPMAWMRGPLHRTARPGIQAATVRGTLMTPHASNAQSIQRAQLTSAVGAGVLGAGLGVMTSQWLRPYALSILALGIVMHAWGIYDKHRLEAGGLRIWWSELLYWICCGGLLALVVLLVARLR